MKNRSRQGGYTLLEMVVSLGLMTIIGGAVIHTSARALAAVQTGNAVGEINAKTGRVMTRIMEEVEALGATTLDPDLVTPVGMPRESSESIEFLSGTGWLAGATVWSTKTRVAFVTDQNEFENGLDDDGDGLIDEGAVVLTLDVDEPGEHSVTLVTGVRGYLEGELLNGLDDNGNGLTDERGLVFTRDSGVLSIDLTMESPAPDGGVLTRSLQNSIRIRN